MASPNGQVVWPEKQSLNDVTHYPEDDNPENQAGEFVPDNFIDPWDDGDDV